MSYPGPYELQGERLTVATAGTPVRFTTTTKLVKGLKVWPEGANTGIVFLQSAAAASGTHARLSCGLVANTNANPVLDFGDAEVDLSQIYFDASANSQVVSICYLQTRG